MSEDTLYWSGGTDCGIPDCVEHAYMRNKAMNEIEDDKEEKR